MNPFIYWVSVFYHWYYDNPNRRKEAYFRALMITISFLTFNVMTFWAAFSSLDFFANILNQESKISLYIKVGLIFIICYQILRKLAPKDKVEAIDYNTLKRFKDRTIAIVYWVASILAFVLVMYFIRSPQLAQ